MEDHRPAMVAWSVVCRPKNQGGLGIANLSVQNKALLLKNLQNSLTDRTFLGLILYGDLIMLLASCLVSSWLGLFGGRQILNWWVYINLWPDEA